jgi:hypothetical protein
MCLELRLLIGTFLTVRAQLKAVRDSVIALSLLTRRGL